MNLVCQRLLLLGAVALCGVTAKKQTPVYNDAFILSSKNYYHRLSGQRKNQLFLVVYYSKSAPVIPKWLEDDDTAKATFPRSHEALFKNVIEPLSHKLKHMIQVGSIDCDKENKICTTEIGSNTKPHIKLFLPNPIPPQEYKGPYTVQAIAGWALSSVPDYLVNIITSDNINEFLKEKAFLPHCLVFSRKDQPSPAIRSQAIRYTDQILFGLVNVDKHKSIAEKYKVSKTPAFAIIHGTPEKVEWFKESSPNIELLAKWLNPFAETRSPEALEDGSTRNARANRPWMSERVPELTEISNHHLCFGTTQATKLCVVYMVEKPKLDESDYAIIESAAAKYPQDQKRNLPIRWVWINIKAHPEWKKLFGERKFPSAALFVTKGKPKYVALSADMVATPQALDHMMSDYNKGFAIFKFVKGGKAPAFSRDTDTPRDEL